MNERLFTKFSGCYCWSFIIHNKAPNKSSSDFALYYRTFSKMSKWATFSEKFIRAFTSDFLIFSNNHYNWVSHSFQKKKLKAGKGLAFLLLLVKHNALQVSEFFSPLHRDIDISVCWFVITNSASRQKTDSVISKIISNARVFLRKKMCMINIQSYRYY